MTSSLGISAAAASGVSTAQVQNAQDIAVLKKAMDVQKLEGQASVALIETAGQVGHGAHEQGKGASVDVRA
ncbi:MAG: YjfB family protein [Planctomycetota bacterium]